MTRYHLVGRLPEFTGEAPPLVYQCDTCAAPVIRVTTDDVPQDGRWHHITVIVEHGREWRYIDGELIDPLPQGADA